MLDKTSDKAEMLSILLSGYINAPSANWLCAYSYIVEFLESIHINFAKKEKKNLLKITLNIAFQCSLQYLIFLYI